MNKSIYYSMRIFFILMVIGSCLIPFLAQAASQTQSGNIQINGIVPGPPPATPPTIDVPVQGQNFDTKNITVSGGCIVGLIVKVFNNNIFAGSTLCTASGTWNVQIDLNIDRNDLIARQYDTLNQSSPDSDTVTVYYVPPAVVPVIPGDSTVPPVQVADFDLRINYDYTLIGIFPGQTFRLPISFFGGSPPYAVSIDWGDGSTSLYSRSNSKEFISEHIYKDAGYKTVTIKVTDALGNTAYLQFILVVNGRVNSPFTTIITDAGRIAIAWPVLALASGICAGMAGGILLERHYLVRRRHKTIRRRK